MLAEGLNFAISPQRLPVVELITATKSAIRNNKISEAEAEQLSMKVTAALSSAKATPSNLTPWERKAVTSLRRDQNINIKGKMHCGSQHIGLSQRKNNIAE